MIKHVHKKGTQHISSSSTFILQTNINILYDTQINKHT